MVSTDDTPSDLLILMKTGPARINQEWHYHLANTAGRPRCGALLNLREWQVRAVAEPPANLCGRCARLLGPRPGKSRMTIRRSGEAPSATQMGLLLDDAALEDEPPNDDRSTTGPDE